MKSNKIKKICIFSFVGVVCASLIAVPLSSYIVYNNSLNNNSLQSSSQAPTSINQKKILQSIEAKLKEGKEFYDNNLARITNEDVIVTAHYLKGEEKIDEVLESDKYTLTSPGDFALKGGVVTISYLNKSVDLNISLIKVEAKELKLTKKPYKTNYQIGSKFDDKGMEIIVVFNDGSTKILKEEDYSYDTEKILTLDDKKITITYNNLTIDIEINVVEHLQKGNIVGLDIDGDALVNVNEKLNTALVNVVGIYENGDRELLSTDDYQIIAEDIVTVFGKKYSIKIKYNEIVSKDIPVIIRKHVEGENTNIVGGGVVTEPEYIFENGVFTKLDNITSAGGFGGSVKDNKDAYISFNVDSYIDTTSDITLRCGNSYLIQENNAYYMKPLQINTIADLSINGKNIEIPDNVVLKGCGPNEAYAPLYGVYYEFTFNDINLDAGSNEIRLTFKSSTEGAINYWSESPSTMNIDYINIDTKGEDTPTSLNVKEIKLSKEPEFYFGKKVADLNFSVIGVLDDNTKIMLNKDEYDLIIENNEEYLGMGDFKYKIVYKANTSLFIEKTISVDSLRLEAESGSLKGNNSVVSKSANEYVNDNGTYKAGEKVTCIYGMDNSATQNVETSITFTFNGCKGKYNLSSRLSNAYYFMENEKHLAKELPLNQVLKLKVNGTYVDIDNVVLPSINPTTDGDYIYLQFFERVLASVDLVDGKNAISIEANNASSLRNKWNEIPVPRFDWFEISKAN